MTFRNKYNIITNENPPSPKSRMMGIDKTIVNILKLQLGFKWRRMLKGTMPMSVSIEPTTSCNLRCPECPSGLRSFTRPTGMIKIEMVEDIMAQLGKWLVYVNLYAEGID